MKYLLIILLLFSQARAQTKIYQTIGTRNTLVRALYAYIPDTLQGLPSDTFPVPLAYRARPFFAPHGDSTYQWSPRQLKWIPAGAGVYSNGYGLKLTSYQFSIDSFLLATRARMYKAIDSLHGIYSLLGHTHVFANITDGVAAVHNLFSAGGGLNYNSSSGQFSLASIAAGAAGQVQYSDGAGAFQATSNFTYSSNTVTVLGDLKVLKTSSINNNSNHRLLSDRLQSTIIDSSLNQGSEIYNTNTFSRLTFGSSDFSNASGTATYNRVLLDNTGVTISSGSPYGNTINLDATNIYLPQLAGLGAGIATIDNSGKIGWGTPGGGGGTPTLQQVTTAGNTTTTSIIINKDTLASYLSNAAPTDALKITGNTLGAVFGIQNWNASGKSGWEAIGSDGNIKTFTGLLNSTGEYRVDNKAASGFFRFKINTVDAFGIANDKSITAYGNVIFSALGSSGIDTTTYKPLVMDVSGNVKKSSYWFGSGGAGGNDPRISATDIAHWNYSWVQSTKTTYFKKDYVYDTTFGKINDSTLIWKSLNVGAGSSKLSLAKTVTDTTLSYVLDVVEANISRNNLGGGALTIANGGTGATTAATALSNLAGAPLASPGLTGVPTAPTASLGTNTTQIATTAFVQAAIANLSLNTGTYTPSFSGGSSTNISSITANTARWFQIGTMVFVSGTFNITPTASAALTTQSFSLPVASTFTLFHQVAGTMAADDNGDAGSIEADLVSGTKAKISFKSSAIIGHNYTYQFAYVTNN